MRVFIILNFLPIIYRTNGKRLLEERKQSVFASKIWIALNILLFIMRISDGYVKKNFYINYWSAVELMGSDFNQ
jgi:hypothetical protein